MSNDDINEKDNKGTTITLVAFVACLGLILCPILPNMFMQNIPKPWKQKLQIYSAEVGDAIEYGNYANAPLEWRVLAIKNNKKLLITKYGIDTKEFNFPKKNNNNTWEESSLRKWLNTNFCIKAFDEKEREYILVTENVNENNPEFNTYGGNITQDKLFCLSFEEVDNYFENDYDRQCSPTCYALVKEGDLDENWNWKDKDAEARVKKMAKENAKYGIKCDGCISAWWLRSPGEKPWQAACVNFDGSVPTNGTFVEWRRKVRPAMWVKSSLFDF